MRVTLLLGALVGAAVTAAAWWLSAPDADPVGVVPRNRTSQVETDGAHAPPQPPRAALRSEPYREADVEDLASRMEEVRAERRFLRTRRKVSVKIAEMLGDDADAIERRITNEEQLAVARRLAKQAMRDENAAHGLVLDVAINIHLRRLESGQFDRVSLVGLEADHVVCEGKTAYRIPEQKPEFPEQFLLTSTLMLEGEEPILRVVRINPGESEQFDALNEQRMEKLREVKSALRNDLARLDKLALTEEASR